MGSNATLVGLDAVMANVDKFAVDTAVKAELATKLIATDNESYAKENRPWTDRTGNARGSITGSTGREGTRFLAALAIGVFYGRYLELDNGGKYAIVWPTMNARRTKMLATVGEAMRA